MRSPDAGVETGVMHDGIPRTGTVVVALAATDGRLDRR
jgi:hypothetical protein